MKRIIAGLALFALVGCDDFGPGQSATTPGNKNGTVVYADGLRYVTRIEDKDAQVTCWATSDGISCLPNAERCRP